METIAIVIVGLFVLFLGYKIYKGKTSSNATGGAKEGRNSKEKVD